MSSSQNTSFLSTTRASAIAAIPDRVVCPVQGCYFNRPKDDPREIQRHARLVHNISAKDFDYGSIGPAQRLVDIQPLWIQQQARQRRSRKIRVRNLAVSASATADSDPVLPSSSSDNKNSAQLENSITLLQIVGEGQTLSTDPDHTQPEMELNSSLPKIPIFPFDKAVDLFSVQKELQEPYKSECKSGSVCDILRAASANLAAMRKKLEDHDNKDKEHQPQCQEYRDHFQPLVRILTYGNITSESLNKAIEIVRHRNDLNAATWALRNSDGLSTAILPSGERPAQASEEVPDLERMLENSSMDIDEVEEEEEEEEEEGEDEGKESEGGENSRNEDEYANEDGGSDNEEDEMIDQEDFWPTFLDFQDMYQRHFGSHTPLREDSF